MPPRRKPPRPPVDLVVVEPTPVVESPTVLESDPDLASEAQRYADASVADATKRARRSDFREFEKWCEEKGVASLPARPADVAAYLVERARDSATTTVVRAAQTIGIVHREAGIASPSEHPQVKKILVGIRREKGSVPNKKAAATEDVLERVLPSGESLHDLRDRALLLFGLTTALRRGNIVAVDVEDLRWVEQGAIVLVRRSKVDQFGKGHQVGLPFLPGSDMCPASALKRWLEAAHITSGPVFRGFWKGGRVRDSRLCDREVARVLQRAIAAAGMDAGKFGAHSLRAGYVTTARQNDVDWPTIMAQTGHRLLSTVKGYSHYTTDVFSETKVASVFGKKEKR